MKAREVRAAQTASTLTVYQAYSPHIAEPALAAGRFVPPFKRERMTWIKPSLLWMAYRCGWAQKEGQERVLAVEITREGFEWALAHASLSHFEPGTYADHAAWEAAKRESPVRVQWDPERSLTLGALSHRAIQVGLSGEAVDRYVDEWIVELRDATDLMRRVHAHVRAGDQEAARALLPVETPYPLSPELAARVGATP
ncbi:DUF4291 domain-containing protein [Solirubrobacter sp. CPCC 204708]|nr:DUF4291 domain-containing protein [Solirubrobacter deserti]